MAISYKLCKFKNPDSQFNNMVYAKADHEDTYDLEALVDHMASHNTPFTRGTISGVIKDMVSCIRELLLDSKNVKLDGLAIFSLGLKGTFASSVEEYSAATNIKGAKVNARGTGEFSAKQLNLDAKFKEKSEYTKEA